MTTASEEIMKSSAEKARWEVTFKDSDTMSVDMSVEKKFVMSSERLGGYLLLDSRARHGRESAVDV